MSRVRKVSDTEFFPYYEIYLQKIVQNQESGENEVRYCLTQSELSLTGERFESLEKVQVPLVQYVDINLSGMPDIVFYHNEAIYTIYNHLLAKTYNEFSINDSQDLC